jgi:hypothetical protein
MEGWEGNGQSPATVMVPKKARKRRMTMWLLRIPQLRLHIMSLPKAWKPSGVTFNLTMIDNAFWVSRLVSWIFVIYLRRAKNAGVLGPGFWSWDDYNSNQKHETYRIEMNTVRTVYSLPYQTRSAFRRTQAGRSSHRLQEVVTRISWSRYSKLTPISLSSYSELLTPNYIISYSEILKWERRFHIISDPGGMFSRFIIFSDILKRSFLDNIIIYDQSMSNHYNWNSTTLARRTLRSTEYLFTASSSIRLRTRIY